jgi:hypothetical protein
VYLGLLLWTRLGFAEFCKEQIPSGREEIPWSIMAAVLVLARFCAPSSELQIAESWYAKTALDDLLGVRRATRSSRIVSTGLWMLFREKILRKSITPLSTDLDEKGRPLINALGLSRKGERNFS